MSKKEIQEQLIRARDEYISLIKSELLGPGSEFNIPDAEHELISSSPMLRYYVGILYPQGNRLNLNNDEAKVTGDDEVEEFNELDQKAPTDEYEEVEKRKEHSYELDETAVGENLDEDISLSAQYMPSSMGFTFIVKGMDKRVYGKVSFATYRKARVSDCVVPYVPMNEENDYIVPVEFSHIIKYEKDKNVFRLLSSVQSKDISRIIERDTLSVEDCNVLKDRAYRLASFCRFGYVREPHNDIEFVLDFSEGDYVDNTKNIDETSAKITARRTKIDDDVWSITVMVVNDLEEVPAQAHNCIYQPVIKIDSDRNKFFFKEIKVDFDDREMDDEEQQLDLLYRDMKNYGIGLGVSVDWKIDSKGSGSIWTEFFPVSEVPPMSFDLPQNEQLSVEQLSMKYLSDLDGTDKALKLNSLRSLVDLYKGWVSQLESILPKLKPIHQPAAYKNIENCKRAYERMYLGIGIFETNEQAYSAFMLANRAMFMQRTHLRMQQETADQDRYRGDEKIEKLLREMDYYQQLDNDCRWRPFQLAFLLMDVASIVDDTSPDRDIVDLIWFPTGGGKTEAYLGLTAFTIFYRRLMYLNESDGTAVIMRYTLRLLAAQQFSRASTLICACEYIRRDCEQKRSKYPRYALGKNSITIGLWIGREHTPNTNKDADKYLAELRNVSSAHQVKYAKEKNNKFQVLKCPWCGTKLVRDNKGGKLVGEWGYSMKSKRHFYMYCPHEKCDFTDSLPLQVVDEELYENPPTLLFGTVDKFANLPWEGKIGNFFATKSSSRTPELIIQDELHLISGALGTIVGLYEVAVDDMCSRKGIRPKIIASTATIRRAKEQCAGLYCREVVQFPPPGLNARDSFFAHEAEISYEKNIFGRKYIGIMPSGKTKAMMEIRATAALLQKAYMMDLPDEIKDKLWTLTVYFNSLKDLGRASTQIDDDVKDFIKRMSNRLFVRQRLIGRADELTSRVNTTELNETLDKLEKLEYSQENIETKRYASNVVLATNMISVGIDIARLNIMLLIGQPKLTSEYIQASSRVGRTYPGLAFVQYDATKSRDRSHYERFKIYHESFYRFVEPTGVTPFSKPACERALHAVVTTMIRQRLNLLGDADAIKFSKVRLGDGIQEIKQFILNRIEQNNSLVGNGVKADIKDIQNEIEAFIEEWGERANEALQDGKQFYFGRRFMVKLPDENEGRLLKVYNSGGRDSAKETLTSMRNVDTPIEGKIIVWEEK